VGWYIIKIDDPSQAAAMSAKLDAQFANSAAETKTSTENAFLHGFVNQIGDVGAIMVAILVAVLFSILLVAANTMSQAVRERTNELAVLKTLGFSNGLVLVLVLGESLFMALPGGIALRWRGCYQPRRHPDNIFARVLLRSRDIIIGVVPAFCWARWQALPGRLSDAARVTDAEEELTCCLDRQTIAVTSLGIRNIPQRLGSSIVAIVGIAGVDRVRAVLSIGEGFKAAMTVPDRRTARSSCEAVQTRK
jgi:hypothetical protein